jgi:hypothetical protein
MAGQIMTRRGQQMMVTERPKAKGAESKHHDSSPVIKVSGTGNFIKILLAYDTSFRFSEKNP